MSQWEKLIAEIMRKSPNLRFEDLYKAMEKVGYTARQSKGGSSHYTFRKLGRPSITLPKQSQMKKVYIEMVYEAVRSELEEG